MEFLKSKKALINMKNTDQQCFMWAVTRALNPVDRDQCKNRGRITKELRLQAEDLNWSGVEFPATRKHFHTFERNNPDIGLVVYTMENEKIHPIWVTYKSNIRYAILFYYNGNYMVVKNESRLLSKQVGSNNNKVHFCRRCYHHCFSEIALENHMKKNQSKKLVVIGRLQIRG